ncbi:MAG: CDP-alcohol phosphatidyltransferase family protein [Clostridia bacterium]|nr:CDP-alcohol phosphatidyltransferase family protein [Clostridia bacterium]
MKLKNIPNLLSVIRICLVFVFVALFFTAHVYAALFVFLLAGATDVLDGYLARKNNWITNLGKILDPLADKLMQCTVLVCLWIGGIIPLWFVIPFFVKEFCTLLIGLIVIKRRSVAVVSKWYGKLTVCLFYLTIVVSTVFESFFDAHAVLEVLLFIPAVAFAVFSFAAYIKHYAYLKHEEINKGTLLKMRKEQ